MEEQGGVQEHGAAPAVATESGPGEAEAFDLSLDDIIKRNQKGQTSTRGNNRWRQPPRNWSPAYSNRRPRFRSWMPWNMQGANRFRAGGPQKPPYFRKPFWNGASRPRRRAAVASKGTSPLNRPASAMQDVPKKPSLPGKSEGAVAETPQGQLARAPQFFRAAGTFAPAQSNRPFRINRRPAFHRHQFRSSFNGGQQAKLNAKGKPMQKRRWQVPASSGAVLTISVSNPQASQSSGPGAKRPFPRGRSTPSKLPPRQPKGVPLRFNFRAVANQTSLTLNERFSGLWRKHRFPASRNPGRMVTLP